MLSERTANTLHFRGKKGKGGFQGLKCFKFHCKRRRKAGVYHVKSEKRESRIKIPQANAEGNVLFQGKKASIHT